MNPTNDDPSVEDPTLKLLRRAMDGDQQAWDHLYREHEDLMRRVLHNRITPNLRRRFDTEDIMQSAFLQLSQHGPDLELADARSLRAWLARVLMNKLRDRIRKVARAASAGMNETRAPTEVVEQHPDDGPTLEELAQKAELMARMYERILALPPDDRDIVVSRFVDQRSWAEIADRTGLGKSTVSKRYNQLLESIVRGFF